MASKMGTVQTTRQTESKPWGEQQPYLMTGMDLAGRTYNNDTPDFAPTIAGLRTAAQGYGAAGDAFRAAAGGPMIGQAQDYAMRTARGDNLTQNNPFFYGMLNNTLMAARPHIDSAFAGAGRLGSGNYMASWADAATRAATNLGYQDYSRERGYQNEANYALPQLAALPAGLLQQGAAANAQGAGFEQAAATLPGQYDWQKLNNYWNIVGRPMGGTQNSTGTEPVQQANTAMQGIGAAAGLMGSLGQLRQGAAGLTALLSFLSDARAKEDIRPVGQLNNGLPVYSYRYKGDPRTQIGLLAQEVAQVKPEAVSEMGGGLLGVNYAAAVT